MGTGQEADASIARTARRRAAWGVGVLAACLLVLGATPARAGDAGKKDGQANAAPSVADQVKQLKRDVRSHMRAAEYSKLDGDLMQAKLLYQQAEKDDDARGEIVDIVGSMAKGRRGEKAAPYVLDALGEMGDPRGSRYVRPFLHQHDLKKSDELLEKAVAVAGKLPDDDLVEPLLRIVEKSKTFGIAAAAMRSLGHFGHVKRYRKQILERLVKTVKKNKPGGRPGMRGSSGGGLDPYATGSGSVPYPNQSDPSARWGVLAGALPGALNALTGQKVASAADWFSVFDGAKRDLDSLFVLEDEEDG